ncbi:MAG: hypothetical protein Q7S21_05330, partial [archaeon]|nr:hypothetical protein [archaeon]
GVYIVEQKGEHNMVEVTEAMRLRLLAEEFKLRKKQPTAWTKTKFRPFANFKTKKRVQAELVPGVATVVVKNPEKGKSRMYIEED